MLKLVLVDPIISQFYLILNLVFLIHQITLWICNGVIFFLVFSNSCQIYPNFPQPQFTLILVILSVNRLILRPDMTCLLLLICPHLSPFTPSKEGVGDR